MMMPIAGHDFKPTVELSVAEQVEKLIQQATNVEHLATCFIGWCAFW
jgi:FKBP12-rapamycin complex-associated protein